MNYYTDPLNCGSYVCACTLHQHILCIVLSFWYSDRKCGICINYEVRAAKLIDPFECVV